MKKGRWSREEDYLIKNHIEKYGMIHSWQGLSETLGLQRCGRSCRSRWLNYLRPGLKHGNFTPAEDRVICEMYSKKGSSWSVIAAQLPGRTDLSIKNYWNCTLKKRFLHSARSIAIHSNVRPNSSPSLKLTSKHIPATRPDVSSPPMQMPPQPAIAGYATKEEPVMVLAVSVAMAGLSPVGNAVKEEPIAAVPIAGPVRIELQSSAMESVLPLEKTLDDHAGEMDMDIACCPMSPLHLDFMDPDLARITGFDDIGGFLSWFDD